MIGIFIAIIFIGSLIYNILKIILAVGLKRFKIFTPLFQTSRNKIYWHKIYKKNSDIPMKVINITTGKCQCCGRNYIGTTEDEDFPLNTIEFMGNTKILCKDCIQKLAADFNQSRSSGDKQFSKTAESLEWLLTDTKICFK